jgi:hypothetical protein
LDSDEDSVHITNTKQRKDDYDDFMLRVEDFENYFLNEKKYSSKEL